VDYPSTFATMNEFGQMEYAPHNKGVKPVFSVQSLEDFAASERAGHRVYRNVETVLLYVVGDAGTAASHPVDAGIIARFPDQYEAWKRKETGSHIKGVPLSKWPMSSPSMIRELEGVNVFSVEDLAAVSDGNIQNFSNGRALREMAIAWLKSAKDGAAAMKYAAENERLRDDLKQAMARLAELEKHVGIKPRQRDRFPPQHFHPAIDEAEKRASTPRKKKNASKSAWTPERRKAAGERLAKARLARRPAAVQELYATHAPSDVEA
jgi:hypothetical protein